ncbi:hypothetical protein [Neisseria canis]|uniref:Lipid A core - O-antigen ligase and related enzymes n=1 Tax=Neisseria canis TaxID=493 RepID=A0A448D8W1_9NEIS|nr:hypothetical protein [Neisseria canis]OSI13300.1 hypothetical protein BWD07_01600 [Neisseria canis]VEF01706.1 Uncharacterised protein [Neisseria canis]
MNNYLIFTLFLIGIMAPASIGGVISSTSGVVLSFTSLIFLFILLFRQKRIDLVNIFVGLGFGVAIAAFTFLSKYYTYKYGNGLYFIVFFFLTLINTNHNPLNLKGYLSALTIGNIFFSVLSIGIILEIPAITEIIREYYASFYDDLIPNMLFQLKPVTIFGTHSVAGFYNFIFVLLNIMAFKYTHQKRFLLATFLFLIYLFFLQSSTSLALLLFSLIILQSELYRYNKHFAYVIYGLELLALVVILPFASDLIDSAIDKMFSENNGLGGRYAEGGNLANNLEYIFNNPLQGIGFGYTTEYMYGDSGYLEYSLRNSILGPIAIVFAFCRFILRNIDSKYAYFLILIYLIFEIGFSNLIYWRMTPITLFAIAFFNQLQRLEAQKSEQAAPVIHQGRLVTN